jgi:uncharacterized Zn-binding protein involved in type VI secretion
MLEHRLGDLNTGHDACPPVPLVTASVNVFINNKGAVRKGDTYAVHSCVAHAPHQDVILNGSATVFINGQNAARQGDPCSYGATCMEHSPNVFIGG